MGGGTELDVELTDVLVWVEVGWVFYGFTGDTDVEAADVGNGDLMTV